VRLIVVSVPGDKRTRALEAAARRQGIDPVWVPWGDALEDPARVGLAGEPGDVLRVDSPGADAATWAALARRGGLDRDVPPGEWRPGRAWFAGLSAALEAIERGAGHLAVTHPHVRAMTDKWACQQRLEAAGVPTPPAIEAPGTVGALRDALDALGWSRVFVKPRWGSSGAGVLAWQRSGRREMLTTTASLQGDRIVNRKRLSTYTDGPSVDRLLATVISDGAIVQRWVPKATGETGPFDLRVLVIDGRIAQRVGRVGKGTITNLHLDAARADPDALLSAWPGAAERVAAAALSAAACFPGHRCVGIDVMVDAAGRPFVIECNAWGDYLPGLLLDGLDAYDLQLRGLFA
jgi:glutathione synthase/RimK-type ligase-like ATP-grasp enzyme